MRVEIIATDEGLAVRPWISALEPLLRVERRIQTVETVVAKQGGLKPVRKKTVRRDNLWHVVDGTGVVLPALLRPTVSALQSMGFEPAVFDMRTPCSAPDWSRLGVDLRDGQPDILRLMCTERHALIKAATGLGKTEAIVQWLRINPGLRVAIVTFQGSVRDSIARRAQAGAGDRTVCVLRSGMPHYRADTYVLADKSLHRLDPDDIDAMIIDEVHGAGSEKAFDQLLRFTGKRVYGLSATPFGRHDAADMVPIALCGPLALELDYDFSVSTGANVPIHVYMYRASGPDWLKGKPDYLRERMGIWRNPQRNALIACLCAGIDPAEQTMVVCRTSEHVLRLRLMMPGYTCVFGGLGAERAAELEALGLLPPGWEGRSDIVTDTGAARDRVERGELLKVICTPLWKEGVDFRRLRWVVRADGTMNPIFCVQAGGRLARPSEGKTSAAVIDFVDDFSDMKWKSDARAEAYRKEGWHVHYMPPG